VYSCFPPRSARAGDRELRAEEGDDVFCSEGSGSCTIPVHKACREPAWIGVPRADASTCSSNLCCGGWAPQPKASKSDTLEVSRSLKVVDLGTAIVAQPERP
jgi:hypothetical protein